MQGLITGDLAATVVDSLTSSICVVDRTGNIVAVNRAWSKFASENGGDARQAYVGTNYFELCQRSRDPEVGKFAAGLRNVLQGDVELFQFEYPCHSPDEKRWFVARVTPIVQRDDALRGTSTAAVVSHVDITERKLLELEYARLASTDALTGLPNRRFFETYANIELERRRRFGGQLAILMFDLDNFKLINDRYGHLAGDQVLKKFATRCKSLVRGSDLFARLGGEEFVALLSGTSTNGALHLAETLRRSIERLRIRIDGATIRVTSSIGVASVTARDRSVNSVLSRADRALYEAKNGGRNQVRSAA